MHMQVAEAGVRVRHPHPVEKGSSTRVIWFTRELQLKTEEAKRFAHLTWHSYVLMKTLEVKRTRLTQEPPKVFLSTWNLWPLGWLDHCCVI